MDLRDPTLNRVPLSSPSYCPIWHSPVNCLAMARYLHMPRLLGYVFAGPCSVRYYVSSLGQEAEAGRQSLSKGKMPLPLPLSVQLITRDFHLRNIKLFERGSFFHLITGRCAGFPPANTMCHQTRNLWHKCTVGYDDRGLSDFCH